MGNTDRGGFALLVTYLNIARVNFQDDGIRGSQRRNGQIRQPGLSS